MRASGEITPAEFVAAKKRLQSGPAPTVKKPVAFAQPGVAPQAASKAHKRRKFKWRYLLLAAGGIWLWSAISGPENSESSKKDEPSKAVETNGVEFLASAYGDDWPYPPYDRAIVRCDMRLTKAVLGRDTIRPIATIILGGTEYGLNGAAMTNGYPDPSFMRPRDPYTGAYTSGSVPVASSFLDTALKLCNYKP